MGRLHMLVSDGKTTREVKVDPAHVSRQARDHRANGLDVTVVDDDEMIRYGQMTQQFRTGK